ncbi:glycosyltransferase [Acetobacter fallax]|nr:glycosyltransferase [Acetobacter fallax]
MTEGKALGFSPNRFFDEKWYLTANPDVASAVRHGGFASGFDHYRLNGHSDRSPHWLFSEAYYLSRYPDLTRSTLDRLGLINGYDHYLTYGDREFRSGHLFFDPRLFYSNALLTPSDTGDTDAARPATAIPELGPFATFLGQPAFGSTVRVTWYFDPQWYQSTYPEVIMAVQDGDFENALHHFLTSITPQAFCALEWFSEDYYLELYPDIGNAISGGHVRSAYDHFVRYGALERRKPHPDIDLLEYFFTGTVRADIENGLVRDAFVHWLSRRHIRARDADASRPELKKYEGLAARKAESLIPLLVRHPLSFTSKEAPSLSVVLYVHNRLPLTLSTLAALRTTVRGSIEVIVVDAGSRDDTRYLEQFAGGVHIVRLAQTTTRPEALKAALPYITTDTVLWLGQGVRLEHGAITAALSQLSAQASRRSGKPRAGIVTGRILRADDRIQEAGTIIWRDGSLGHYMEGAALEVPEASFRRLTACGTVPCLLISRALIETLDGFSPEFASEAGALADFSLRAAEKGFATLYEPAMIATLDVRDADAPSYDTADMRTLRRRHAAALLDAEPPSPTLLMRARTAGKKTRRILFIEDRIPTRRLGSGFVRSNDIVRTMAALGHEVTVAPIYSSTAPLPAIYADFPPEVELLHDRNYEVELDRLLQERSGAYDCVWIGRTHNLGRLLPILMGHASCLPTGGIVLDTEAVTAPRTALRAELLHLPQTGTVSEALEEELSCAWLCETIVAVNAVDAAVLRDAGYDNVAELGHLCPVRPTPATWSDRRDLLFLGAIHEPDSPNHDSLIWFIREVLPLLKDRLPDDVRFTVAGFLGPAVDLSALGRDPRVELIGPVADTSELYKTHRVFVAPTRFAGGIPFKVHEAASYGLPVVASDLLCRQLGWRDGLEIVSGGTNDPQRFAARLADLYSDEELWTAVRAGSLQVLADENSEKSYMARLSQILQNVFANSDRSSR